MKTSQLTFVNHKEALTHIRIPASPFHRRQLSNELILLLREFYRDYPCPMTELAKNTQYSREQLYKYIRPTPEYQTRPPQIPLDTFCVIGRNLRDDKWTLELS